MIVLQENGLVNTPCRNFALCSYFSKKWENCSRNRNMQTNNESTSVGKESGSVVTGVYLWRRHNDGIYIRFVMIWNHSYFEVSVTATFSLYVIMELLFLNYLCSVEQWLWNSLASKLNEQSIQYWFNDTGVTWMHWRKPFVIITKPMIKETTYSSYVNVVLWNFRLCCAYEFLREHLNPYARLLILAGTMTIQMNNNCGWKPTSSRHNDCIIGIISV